MRFPTFIDDWCISTIGKNFKLSSGLTPSTKEKTFFNNGTIAWINSGELKDKYIKRTDNLLTKKAVEKHNLTVYPPNTMIIAIYGLEAAGVRGKASITKMNSTISQSCIAFEPIGVVSEQFMYYLYKKEAKILGTRYAQGTKQQNLSSDLLITYKIHYPTKLEQKNITNFLSKIDDRIDTQIKIISDKISLKNQLSNDFFTSCHDYLKLDEFIKYGKAGGTPKSTNKDYYNGKIPFLSISDITEQGKYITRTSKTISKLGIKNSSSWIVPENSLILSMYASVGLPTINKISLATSQAMYSMILKDSDNLEFLYYYLCYFQKYKLNSYLETGTQSNINANTVKSISIPNINKIERIKIANIMTKIDYSISFEKEILDNYQLQKCYLLKNMFI